MNIDFSNGEKYLFIPADMLLMLQKGLKSLKTETGLNSFQKWLLDEYFDFSFPETGFAVKSVLLTAVPHPFYSNVTLNYNGKKYRCLSLVSSDFDSAEKDIAKSSRENGFSFHKTRKLPLKRLAVQSGLSVYGRNNITYIDGMGSSFSYLAFFTDVRGDDVPWRDPETAPMCGKCTACLQACPTGAIRNESFIIDNQKCLSYLNESPDPFPDWLPETVHHTLYDCMYCQMKCPMNHDQLRCTGDDIEFSEDEVSLLLNMTPFEDFPEPLRKKGAYLGLDQWPDGIAKNIKMIIDRQRP